MKIRRLIWPDDRIEHIARHGIEPDEVEQVCYGKSLVQRAKAESPNPVYYILWYDQFGTTFVLRGDPISRRDRLSGNCSAYDRQRTTPLSAVEESMSTKRLPKTDSIEELATFWDSHDLTDFDDQLEEVSECVFDRDATFTIHLDRDKAEVVKKLAESQGFPVTNLIQLWIDERIDATRMGQSN